MPELLSIKIYLNTFPYLLANINELDPIFSGDVEFAHFPL